MSFIKTLPTIQDNPLYEAFCALRSLIYVLRARHYDITKFLWLIDEDETNKKIYNKFRTNKEYQKLEGIKFELEYEEGYKDIRNIQPLEVIFMDDAVLANELKDERLQNAISEAPNLVHSLIVTNERRQLIYAAKSGSTLEILCYQQLLLNPLLHLRTPKFRILSPGEYEETFGDRLIGKLLITMTREDPLILFLNLYPGDIIECSNPTFATGGTHTVVSYRITPPGLICLTEGCLGKTIRYGDTLCEKCLIKDIDIRERERKLRERTEARKTTK